MKADDADAVANLAEATEHVVAVCAFLEARGLNVRDGLMVLLMATGQLVGHVQAEESDERAEEGLTLFLEIVRQTARLAVRRTRRTNAKAAH